MTEQEPLRPSPSPVAPVGWKTTWSEEHSQWYYVNIATGYSQWEYPPVTEHAAQPGSITQQSTNDHTFLQQESASIQGEAQSENSRGFTSMAAGTVLGHKMHQQTQHNNHHHVLDSMVTLLGSAGVGAIGAKLFGGKKQPQTAYNTSSSIQPPFHGYNSSAPPAQFYNTQPPMPHYTQPLPPGPIHSSAIGVASGPFQQTVAAYPQDQHHQPSSGSFATGGSAGHYSSSFTSGPRLIIHAASFADKNVTEGVRMMINQEQQISIQKKMTEEFGDPWPEAGRKALSILYQYGDRPMEVWAGSTENDSVTIKNEALSNARMSYINKKPGRIICLIWGNESVLSDVRIDKLEKEGELDLKDLGNGGWWAWEPRTLICYYRAAHGGIEVAHARENGTLRLPWNPLAKWS